jgi:hypothetical protein
MKVHAARNAEKTRIRIQPERFDLRLWVGSGWELRTGEISQETWEELANVADDVDMERLHQELWASFRTYTG